MMGYYQRSGDGSGVNWVSGPITTRKALREHVRCMEPVVLAYPEVYPDEARKVKRRAAARTRYWAKRAAAGKANPNARPV